MPHYSEIRLFSQVNNATFVPRNNYLFSRAALLGTSLGNWWNVKNQGVITLSDNDIIFGFTNVLPLRLGLNLCVILAKYYIYTASRRKEYIWQAFCAFLRNHLGMEKHKSINSK